MRKRLLYFSLILMIWSHCLFCEIYDLAALMIFRDEAPYLKEWIEYHKLLGVQHFYLYNNLSSDNYLKVLDPYINLGEVELTEWPYESNTQPEWNTIQLNAYNNALKKAKKQARWLAILDADEFLVPVHENNLVDFLIPYEKSGIGGILVTWVVFGTSCVEKIPDDKLLIETLILNGGGGHSHFKSIVRTDCVSYCSSPHYCQYVNGFSHLQLPLNEIQMNHYWSRDEYFLYNYKIPRRKKWGTSEDTCVHWATHQNNYTSYSLPILRFVEPLREVMELSGKK